MCRARTLSRGRPPGPAASSSRRMELAETALIRVPPCLRIASMKQGPFSPSGLCRPADRHYYDPLRLPLGNPPFPGSAGYRQATLPGPQYPGPRRLSPVPRTTFRPFHAPYAGKFFDDRSRSEIVFRGLRQTSTGSAPPWPARGRGLNHDAAGFTSCCGLVGCTPPRGACHSTSTSPFRATPGVSYRGPWRLPGPDFHRLAILSLSSGYIVHIPSELGRRPDCWTYTCCSTSLPAPVPCRVTTRRDGWVGRWPAC